jgi:hypothetical protein
MVLAKGHVATTLKRFIGTKKFVAGIIWTPYVFHVLDLLGDRAKFNTTYFLTNIVARLQSGIFPGGRKG